MALSANSKIVLDYVRAHDGEQMTAGDIAEGTGLGVRTVNGVVTAAFQKKGYMVRTEAEVEVTKEDGSKGHKTVKFISLTDEGRTHDFDAEESKDAE